MTLIPLGDDGLPPPEAAAPLLPLFAYGTLAEGPMIVHLLEREVPSEPARLDGYAPGELSRLPYPVLAEKRGGSVAGRLFRDLTRRDYARLDAYEGVREGLYRRAAVEVVAESAGEAEPAYVYLATEKTLRRYG